MVNPSGAYSAERVQHVASVWEVMFGGVGSGLLWCRVVYTGGFREFRIPDVPWIRLATHTE